MTTQQRFYAQPIPVVCAVIVALYLISVVIMSLLRRRSQRVVGWIGVAVSIWTILFFTVVGRTSESAETTSLVPLISFYYAKRQPELYREIFFNVLLFIPLGLTLPFALFGEARRRILLTAVTGSVISLLIECSQLVFVIGKCETDDVIMNTLGVLIGCTAYRVHGKMRKRVRCRGKRLLCALRQWLDGDHA